MFLLCAIQFSRLAVFEKSLPNSSSADQQQGEMAAAESAGGFSQKRNTNSQVGETTRIVATSLFELFAALFKRFDHSCRVLVWLLIFSPGAHVTGVGNGQVNFAHTGCSRLAPAASCAFRSAHLAVLGGGVARGVC